MARKRSLITDHAIVRWIERVLGDEGAIRNIRDKLKANGEKGTDRRIVDCIVASGISQGDLERAILDEEIISAVSMGCSSIRINGIVYKIENNTIITVYKLNRFRGKRRQRYETKKDLDLKWKIQQNR